MEMSSFVQSLSFGKNHSFSHNGPHGVNEIDHQEWIFSIAVFVFMTQGKAIFWFPR